MTAPRPEAGQASEEAATTASPRSDRESAAHTASPAPAAEIEAQLVMPNTVAHLRPCPFCGGPAEITNPTHRGHGHRPMMRHVGCTNHQCAGWLGVRGYDLPGLVEAWNRRALLAPSGEKETG